MTIFLHCGWPKTGTTSLQAALAAHRPLLADAGVIFPDGWHRNDDDSHNGIADMLKASTQSGLGAFDELVGFLESNDDKSVLISSEGLTTGLLDQRERDAFLLLVGRMRDVAPVHCIWALRRIDDLITSLFLQTWRGRRMALELPRFMEVFSAENLFAGMQQVGNAADSVTYLRYEPTGEHAGKLLEAIGLSSARAGALGNEMRSAPRHKSALTHKQVLALCSLEALSARCGQSVDETALLRVFRQGFRFDHDRPCEPVDPVVRRGLHERALGAAREAEISAYARFFESAQIPDSRSFLRIGARELDGVDLDRLADLLAAR